MKSTSFIFQLVLVVIFLSCSSDSPVQERNIDETPFIYWDDAALNDNTIFRIYQDQSDGIYAFSGLKVYYSKIDSLDFTELTELNNRPVFIAEPDSGWIVSIEDSVILYSNSNTKEFQQITVSERILNDALIHKNTVISTTQIGEILQVNLENGSFITRSKYPSGTSLSLISLSDGELFLKADRDILRTDDLDFPASPENLSMGFSELNLPTSNVTALSKTGTADLLIAGTKSMKILLSEDNGVSWSETGPEGISYSQITDIMITGNHIFISILGSGVFSSTDNGQSWVSRNTTKLDWNVYGLYYSNQTGVLAATSSGVFRMYHSGENFPN